MWLIYVKIIVFSVFASRLLANQESTIISAKLDANALAIMQELVPDQEDGNDDDQKEEDNSYTVIPWSVRVMIGAGLVALGMGAGLYTYGPNPLPTVLPNAQQASVRSRLDTLEKTVEHIAAAQASISQRQTAHESEVSKHFEHVGAVLRTNQEELLQKIIERAAGTESLLQRHLEASISRLENSMQQSTAAAEARAARAESVQQSIFNNTESLLKTVDSAVRVVGSVGGVYLNYKTEEMRQKNLAYIALRDDMFRYTGGSYVGSQFSHYAPQQSLNQVYQPSQTVASLEERLQALRG